MVPESTAPGESARIDLFIDLLKTLGEARFSATGSSMFPSVRSGDILTVRQCDARDASVGDIALFIRSSRLFAHRVIAHSDGSLMTQGDAIAAQDPPVSGSEFLARVVSVSRAGREVPVCVDNSIFGRLTTALVRRSSLGSRILQRGYRLRRRAVAA